MKKDIHPEYKTIDVVLADGSKIQMRSTMSDDKFTSDVDSSNHPFYTGKRQFVDTAGRVEKFQRKYGKRKGAVAETEDADAKEAPAEKVEAVAETPVEAKVEKPAEAKEAPAEPKAEAPAEEAPAEDAPEAEEAAE